MYETNLTIFDVDDILIYLRKSRKDLEYGKEETIERTLQRHEEILQKFAIKVWGKKIPEKNIYREVVSGDTIADRPMIQQVLNKVESPKIKGVLVLELERLARGNTIDQGVIVQTFEFTNTIIITPQKAFDLKNDFDISFFEDGLYQARKYLTYIKKVLLRGRVTSVNEGKFVGSTCPYGYSKEKIKGDKGFKLIINEAEAKIVRIIFEMSTKGIGASNIANHLNKIGSKPRKAEVWVSASIRSIIENPVYIGKIRWNWRKTEKTMKNGKVIKSRPKHEEYILVNGLHEAIINEETFNIANKNKQDKNGKSVRKDLTIQNPLAGLVECGYCHRTMQRRPHRSYKIDGLICPLPHCQNIGSHLYLVENAILSSLEEHLSRYEQIVEDYKKNGLEQEIDTNTMDIINKELEKSKLQLNNIYNLLEQGLYDNKTFIERNNILKSKIQQLEEEKEKKSVFSKNKELEKIKDVIPRIKNIIKNYNTYSVEDKNAILRGIIAKVYYTKNVKGKGHESDFELKIIMK